MIDISTTINRSATRATSSANKLFLQVIIHIAAWSCFLMLPLILFPRPKEPGLLSEQVFNLYYVVMNVFYISFYYFNSGLLIPGLLEKKKYAQYTVIIILLLVFFGMLPRLYQHVAGDLLKIPSAIRLNRPRNTRPPILSPGAISIFLLVFIFSTGMNIVNQWLRSERRSKQIENEKLSAELSFLKAQINPHFLFNTLNNIYALAEDRSEQTAPAVMKLSSIMRYVLTEARNDLVALDKEIQFISDYIELQKMRSTNKTLVSFVVQGETTGRYVTPLIFLPFIENAFKYGISTREMSPIEILLEINEQFIHFRVRNNKHINTSVRIADNTGIGIQNTKRRLELLFPNRYTLDIADERLSYMVNLKLSI
jgi:two-component system, LytTR family, sensor kinase